MHVIFSSSSVLLRAFSMLCVYSKLGHHPHPLGYLCAKFCFFFRGLHCWASHGEKSHTHSPTHSPVKIQTVVNDEDYLMPWEPKLSLRNNHRHNQEYDVYGHRNDLSKWLWSCLLYVVLTSTGQDWCTLLMNILPWVNYKVCNIEWHACLSSGPTEKVSAVSSCTAGLKCYAQRPQVTQLRIIQLWKNKCHLTTTEQMSQSII